MLEIVKLPPRQMEQAHHEMVETLEETLAGVRSGEIVSLAVVFETRDVTATRRHWAHGGTGTGLLGAMEIGKMDLYHSLRDADGPDFVDDTPPETE